jgi:hypothetical protein
MGEYKICTHCNKLKHISEYHKNKTTSHGLRHECKMCRAKERSSRQFKDRADRFWKFYHSHTKRNGDCLEWTGDRSNGYATYAWDGKRTMAARIVYRLAIGELSDEQVVLRDCNNPLCVRHSHLRLGTQDDLLIKRAMIRPVGERNSVAKLKEEDVVKIRDMYATKQFSCAAIAKQFNVTDSCIRNIVKRNTWAHVE